MNPHNDTAYEPAAWLILFGATTGKPWLDRIIPGRFKHVSAAGWVAGAKTWVFYDAAWRRTSLKLLPDKEGDRYYAVKQRGHGVLKVEADPDVRGRALFRAGFWCVPAVKHLLGSRSGALRPDRLWHDLVAAGAEIISDV